MPGNYFFPSLSTTNIKPREWTGLHDIDGISITE